MSPSIFNALSAQPSGSDPGAGLRPLQWRPLRRPVRPSGRSIAGHRARSDFSKGPEELLEHRPDRVNWSVPAISSVLILVFSTWAILMPGNAQISMNSLVIWIATNVGWYHVLTVTLVVGFI